MFFYFFVFLLFLSDMFAFDKSPEIKLTLTLIFPILFLVPYAFKNKSIDVPKKITLFYFLFLLFSLPSLVMAADKEVALRTILTYVSAFFVFVYSFINKDRLKKNFRLFIIYSSVIFIATYYLDKLFGLKLFENGASLFYSYDHNQLGNILVPATLLAASSLSSMFFLTFIFFSQSRIAFLSLLVTIFLQTRGGIRKNLTKIFIVVVAVFSIILITNNLSVAKNKKLFGLREIYFSYALDSIKERPIVGVGPGNFYFAASKRQVDYNENTTTAHNIILDISAENGVIAGLFFLTFLFFVLRGAKKDAYFYSFIALTTVFLFDFSYRYNSFLFLWFLLLGLIVQEKKFISVSKREVILAIAVFIGIALGYFLIRFNKEKINKVSGESFIVTRQQADYYYEDLRNEPLALFLYKKTLYLYPFLSVSNPEILGNILNMNIRMFGKPRGEAKMVNFLASLLDQTVAGKSTSISSTLKAFCLDNGLKCYNIRHFNDQAK